MSTEKQIAANRQNAQLSTGARTDAGRAASSRNALQHGLAARGLVILDGQESAFEQLESDFRGTLIPNGPLQEVIFKRALESAWNLERCRLAEATLHSRLGSPTLDPLLDDGNEARYTRIHKYAREAENSMYKAMRELGRLQAEDRYRHETAPLTKAQSESDELFAQTPHALSQVCSATQVTASVISHRRNEAKINGISLKSELKAVANITPQNEIRRFEANLAAIAIAPQLEVARAAA